MALGTITVGVKEHAPGHMRMDLMSFAGDGSYPTNGTAAFQASVRAALGVGNVEVLAVIPQDCGGYVPCYDKAADKLKVYYSNSDSSDGPLIEVPNATSLSGVTFKVMIVSR